MFVVGATRPEMLQEIRSIVPNNFLLVPGVGAQGGSLKEVAQNGLNHQCGLLVNSSRKSFIPVRMKILHKKLEKRPLSYNSKWSKN